VKSLWYMFAINLGQLISQNSTIEGINTIIISSCRILFEPFLYSLQSTIYFYSAGKANLHFIQNSDYLTCLRLCWKSLIGKLFILIIILSFFWLLLLSAKSEHIRSGIFPWSTWFWTNNLGFPIARSCRCNSSDDSCVLQSPIVHHGQKSHKFPLEYQIS
jgi:hypothetical protein